MSNTVLLIDGTYTLARRGSQTARLEIFSEGINQARGLSARLYAWVMLL